LGLSLAALGIRLIQKQIWLGIGISVLMLVLMRFPRVPEALIAVVAGAAVGIATGISPPLPHLDLGIHLPHVIWPSCDRRTTEWNDATSVVSNGMFGRSLPT
jgi:ABC-type enterobactin transport system permease subunit